MPEDRDKDSTLRLSGYDPGKNEAVHRLFNSNLFGRHWGAEKAVTYAKQLIHSVLKQEILNPKIHILAEGMGVRPPMPSEQIAVKKSVSFIHQHAQKLISAIMLLPKA